MSPLMLHKLPNYLYLYLIQTLPYDYEKSKNHHDVRIDCLSHKSRSPSYERKFFRVDDQDPRTATIEKAMEIHSGAFIWRCKNGKIKQTWRSSWHDSPDYVIVDHAKIDRERAQRRLSITLTSQNYSITDRRSSIHAAIERALYPSI
jgi:hypothetical protein